MRRTLSRYNRAQRSRARISGTGGRQGPGAGCRPAPGEDKAAMSWEGYPGCRNGGFATLGRRVRRSATSGGTWTPDWASGPLLRRLTRGAGRDSGAGEAFRGGLVGERPEPIRLMGPGRRSHALRPVPPAPAFAWTRARSPGSDLCGDRGRVSYSPHPEPEGETHSTVSVMNPRGGHNDRQDH